LNDENNVEMVANNNAEGGQREEVIDFNVADNLKPHAQRSEARPAAKGIAVNAK